MQGVKRLAFLLIGASLAAGNAVDGPPEILRISPTSGTEGTRVEISGRNLQNVTAVFLGASRAAFKSSSPQSLVAIVPQRTTTGTIRVVSPGGSGSSPFPFAVLTDPRVPDEVKFRAGYVNPDPRPVNFGSVLVWGIAIADTRSAGYEAAKIDVAWTQLSCRVNGREVVLNDDRGKLRGGLYRRNPWFGINDHEPMPLDYEQGAVVMHVGSRADKVWHFWSASPRAVLPAGDLAGCTVMARIRISPGALVQMGMDYWKDSTGEYVPGNSHEAGASNWYFPSERWQEAEFTDVGGPQF